MNKDKLNKINDNLLNIIDSDIRTNTLFNVGSGVKVLLRVDSVLDVVIGVDIQGYGSMFKFVVDYFSKCITYKEGVNMVITENVYTK